MIGWYPNRSGAMPPCPHAVAVLPPLPHALRNVNGKFSVDVDSLNSHFLTCTDRMLFVNLETAKND